jgi:hypothetical protein
MLNLCSIRMTRKRTGYDQNQNQLKQYCEIGFW